MYATLHPLRGAPGPQDVSWVGPVVDAVGAVAAPTSITVSTQLVASTGLVTCLWADADLAARAAAAEYRPEGTAVVVGAGQVMDVVLASAAAGQAPVYLEVFTFGGPRTRAEADAHLRAVRDRIEPATRGTEGFAGALGLRGPDLGAVDLVFAASMDSLEEGNRRAMSTALLPGEDPALLGGPDRIDLHRVLHASDDLIPAVGAR